MVASMAAATSVRTSDDTSPTRAWAMIQAVSTWPIAVMSASSSMASAPRRSPGRRGGGYGRCRSLVSVLVAGETEEGCFLLTLQPYVETQRSVSPSGRDQAVPLRRREGGQQRIGGQGLGVLGQVDPGEEAVEQAPGEDHDADDGRLARLGGSGVDGGEAVLALGVDRGAPEAGEGEAVSAQRSRRAGHGAVLIRLPDLEEGIGDGDTCTVVDDTVQAHGPGRARGHEFAVMVIG